MSSSISILVLDRQQAVQCGRPLTRILSAPGKTSGTANGKAPQMAISESGDKPASWDEHGTGTAAVSFINFLKSWD
jgi:hypothetical protein